MQLGVLEYLISVNNSGLKQGLKDSEKEVNGFGSDAIDKIKQTTKKAASSVVSFVKDSLSVANDFDAKMAQVAATMGKTVAEMDSEIGETVINGKKWSGTLTEFARKMGSETAFTASEASEALNYMALAGYKTEEAMAMLPTVLNLAAAGDIDLARASDMVTDAQTAFGISFERTTQMVDEMAKAASTGNTSVEQLGDAFLVVGGLAKELNGGFITLEDGTKKEVDGLQELEIALTAMANAGIKGSEAGTHMRNMLLKLSSPTEAGTKALEAMGISVFDAEGKMRSLQDIFGELGKSFKTMTQEEKMNVISDLFNTRDMASATALISAIEGDWNSIGASILKADGAAQKMADTLLDNLAGDWTIFQSAVSEAKISLVQGLTPALRKLTQFGTQAITRLTKAFNKRGLKGVLKSLWDMAGEFISKLRSSDNPIIQTIGTALARVRELIRIVQTAFRDFPKALNMAKGLVKRLFGDIKGLAKRGKIKLAELLGIEDAENASWWDIGSKLAEKLKDGFKSALGKAKVGIANLLGLTDENGQAIDDPSDVSWGNIASAAVKNIKDKIKGLADNAKIQIADILGIEDAENATWTDIATGIADKIKGKFAAVKLKIADILGLESAEDATWGTIAGAIAERIKDKFGGVKIKIADLLGIENAEDATWGTIASSIADRIKSKFGDAKIKIADLLGIENAEDASWSTIAGAITDRIKGKLGDAKIKIADLLGIENAEDASWTTIAGSITDRIKAKFGDLKIKIADLLGIENAEDASWGTIAGSITDRIKAKFGDTKIKIADLLGIEDAENATWGDIATTISDRIKAKLGEVKLKIADLLGLEDTENATWSDIGKEIGAELVKALKKLKISLLSLIIGEGKDESEYTFTNAAKMLKDKISKAFEEGGFLDTFVKNFIDKFTAGLTLAGELVAGLAEWLSKENNVKLIADTITDALIVVLGAIDKIILPLAEALVKMLTDPSFINAIMELTSTLIDMAVQVVSSPDLWNAIAVLADNVARMIFGDTIVGNFLGSKKKLETYDETYWENGEKKTRSRTRVVDDDDYEKSSDNIFSKLAKGLLGLKEGSFEAKATDFALNDVIGTVVANMGKPELPISKMWRIVKLIGKGADMVLGTEIEDTFDEVENTMEVAVADVGVKSALVISRTARKAEEIIDTSISYLENLAVALGGSTPYTDYGGVGSGSMPGTRYIQMPKAKGDWYVPYDNYPALLHRGEMVLTKSQARQFRDGGDGIDYNRLEEAIIASIRNGMEGATVNSYISGRAVTDDVNRNTGRQLKARRFRG